MTQVMGCPKKSKDTVLNHDTLTHIALFANKMSRMSKSSEVIRSLKAENQELKDENERLTSVVSALKRDLRKAQQKMVKSVNVSFSDMLSSLEDVSAEDLTSPKELHERLDMMGKVNAPTSPESIDDRLARLNMEADEIVASGGGFEALGEFLTRR
jgi:predicted RNase H-like nuclease (RuvC/YqgF family)